ncbi:helix-turn-helix domain-containing protein [Hwanghaeella sp.]|uniref:helix-turn-helix domain-containing protein n=1 Tax=Hwanghaeella sp. TaxID=2605943 RepID=UPI003CCBC984
MFIPAGRPGIANPIDEHVGARIRMRRIMLGLSQQKLGEALGLTFQQLQKYERGTNRVGASRLWDLATVLEVPLAFFFDDMPADVAGNSPRLRAGVEGNTPTPEVDTVADPLAKRETLELARAYYKIKDPAVRKRVFELVKAQAKVDAG